MDVAGLTRGLPMPGRTILVLAGEVVVNRPGNFGERIE